MSGNASPTPIVIYETVIGGLLGLIYPRCDKAIH